LEGWRPRGVSLISEHQAHLERLYSLAQVEKTRQLLALKELVSPGESSKREISESEAERLKAKVAGILMAEEVLVFLLLL